MKRLLPIVLTATLLLATATGGIWLGFSESGLGALARLAAVASGGRLSLEQPSGRLVGPLAVRPRDLERAGNQRRHRTSAT